MERSQADLHNAFQAECNAKSRLGPQEVLNTVPAIRQRVIECRKEWLMQPEWERRFDLPGNRFVFVDGYPEGTPAPGRFEDVCYKIIGCWNSARLIEDTPPPPPMPTAILNYRVTDLQDALAAADALLRWCDEAVKLTTAGKHIGKSPLLTEPLNKTELGTYFNCNRNDVKRFVLDKYPHEICGEGRKVKYRMHVASMPLAYTQKYARPRVGMPEKPKP